MAIKLATNFALNSQQPLDARNQYKTLADLKAVTDAVMDDGHLAYCLADKKYYVYNSGNTVDANVGKWRELQTTVPGKGQPGGVASLGSDGKVPASQLPSYVDDVLDYTMEVSGQADGASAMPNQTVVGVVYDKTKKVFLAAYSGGAGVSYAKKWTDVNGDTKLGWQAYGVEKDGFVVPTAGKIYVYTGNDANPEKPESKRWLEGTGLVAIGGGNVDLSNYATTDKAGGSLAFSSDSSKVAIGLRSIASPTTNSVSIINIPGAQKNFAGVMTAADKGKLDLIGFVEYSLGIQGNTLNFTRVREDASTEVQAVTLPSGGTADGKLSNEDINGAIAEAFK